jgi:hypothetical protein
MWYVVSQAGRTVNKNVCYNNSINEDGDDDEGHKSCTID